MKIASVTHCTSKKSLASNLTLPDQHGDQQSLARQWVGIVDSSEKIVEAGKLYTGRGFKLVSQNSSYDDLFVISAGLGLVNASTKIPAYNLTISPGHADSLDQFCETKIDLEDWWSSLAKVRLSEGFLCELAKHYDYVIVSLTAQYLEMIKADLEECGTKVVLIASPTCTKTWKGKVQLAPYSEHFDGPDSPLPGTKSDFAQRCHSDFLDRLRKSKSLEAAISSVTSSMSEWRKPVSLKNTKHSDVELISLIQKCRSDFSSISALHKHFRHELGIACEQKRFSKLVRNADGLPHEA